MGTKFLSFGKENYSMEKEKPRLNPVGLVNWKHLFKLIIFNRST